MQSDTSGYNFEAPKAKKWWQRISKKSLIVGGAVILVLVIAVIALNSGGSNNQKQNNTASVYYDRPGFPRKELGSGIGDPAALVLKENTTPVAFQGVHIIQACNVFDLDDIKATGLILEPHNEAVPFSRSFFDGQGMGELRTGLYDFALQPAGHESNSCRYDVAGREGPYLEFQVFQVPYSHSKALDGELADYQAIGQIGGLPAYRTTSGEGLTASTTTILRSGNSALKLQTNLVDTGKQQAVLEKAVANFSRLLAAPDGPSKVAYDSPLMPNGGIIACNAFQASDIKLVFNAEADPIANEAAASAVGVIRPTGTTPYNYIQTECTRSAAQSAEPSINLRAITLNATTYSNEKGAKGVIAFHKTKDKNVTATSPVVGDESFFTAGQLGRDKDLVVRKGAVVLYINTAARDKTVRDLVPLAQAVVSRLP